MRVKQLARVFVLVAAMASFSGCYKMTFATSETVPAGEPTEVKGHFLVWGLIGNMDIDLAATCPSGVQWFQRQQTFVDGLLRVITIGIYQPFHVMVKCNGGSAFLLGPDFASTTTVN